MCRAGLSNGQTGQLPGAPRFLALLTIGLKQMYSLITYFTSKLELKNQNIYIPVQLLFVRKKLKQAFHDKSNCDVTVETGIISGVLLNNKVGGRLELISNLMV